MIIMDGQEIVENTKNKNKSKLSNKELSDNVENNNTNKTDKTESKKYVKQFLQKALIILFKIIIIYAMFTFCRDFFLYKGHKSSGRHYGYNDVLFDMLNITTCVFSIFKNLTKLFKYEENYNMFEEFEKYERDYIHRKIKERSNNGNNDDVIIDKYIERKSIVLKADDIKIKNKE